MTVEGQLKNYILPRFGNVAVDDVDETTVQEFVADLKRSTFERRRRDGSLLKTYRLSRFDLGKPQRPAQRYFTAVQMRAIIEAASGQYRTLFALLAGTGMRIGEAAGLHLDDVDFDGRRDFRPPFPLAWTGTEPKDGERNPGDRHRSL